jgi:hypothetical protein
MKNHEWDTAEIKRAAQQSGKPLEGRCAMAFSAAGWMPYMGTHFMQPHGKARELDRAEKVTVSVSFVIAGSIANHDGGSGRWRYRLVECERDRLATIETMHPHSLTDCPERVRLSTAVAKAVQSVYAIQSSDRTLPDFREQLQAARKAERDAVAALNKHRAEHEC